MNNQEVQQATVAFKACEEQHIQQITDRLTNPDRPVGQPFYIDHGNQVWGPEGLYCDGWTGEMAQQICDALNLLPSALFWLAYAEGNHIDAGDIPEGLLVKLRETIGTSGEGDRRAGASQDFDYATKTGLIQ